MWEKNDGVEKRRTRGFRVAKVIESSHYRYTGAALLSFALLMIYRKQINDLNSSNKLRKTPSICGGSRIVSRDSSATSCARAFRLPLRLCMRLTLRLRYENGYVKQSFRPYNDCAIAIRECKTLFTIGSNYSKLYLYVCLFYQEDNFLIGHVSTFVYVQLKMGGDFV